MIRLALIDFDGTLADSRDQMLSGLDDAARRFGFRQVDAAEVEALRGLDTSTILRELRVPRWKLPLIARHIRRLATAAPASRLFPGTEAMLARLAAGGVTLGLVTSNTEANARRALGDTASLFAHWACDAALFGKAARFRKVLRAAGVPPEAAVAIGDELRDIEAARAVGMRAAVVAWGFAKPETLAAAGPDTLFARVEDIAPWFGLPPG